MSLRFDSLKAMQTALGPRVRVRDSFGVNKSQPEIRAAASQSGPGQAKRNQGRSSNPRPKRNPRSGAVSTPHDILWGVVSAAYAGAVREFENVVPGRKYRLDIAIPAAQLAIEVDGWEWHGKHKGDFQRDRERQNLLTLNGWRILRFTAGQIRKDATGCLNLIERAVAQRGNHADRD